jgi:hypothetical protein
LRNTTVSAAKTATLRIRAHERGIGEVTNIGAVEGPNSA